MDVTVALGI